MKPNLVTVLSFTVVGVIVAAFLYAAHMERRVYASYEAEVSMHNALSSLKSLQVNIRAMQSERANLRFITREWEEARVDFEKSLQSLNQGVQAVAEDLPQLRRMLNTWQRMESVHGRVRTSMDALERAGLLARVGNSSLMVKYQELLTQAGGSDLEVAELSLLLFYLEHADRLILEIESELRSLELDLQQETRMKMRDSRTAALSVLALAMVVMAGLLVRIARLYQDMAKDNAARVAAEEAAHVSENDLRRTINAIGDSVIATDREGRITRMNPAAETLLQCPATDVGGGRLTQFCRVLHPDTKAETTDPVSLALSGEESLETNGQFLLVQRDGNERLVSVTSARIGGGEHGSGGGVVVVLHDTTERQRLEDQIRRTQKLESLGQLAGGVAHDFNNLLQVIKANLAFIQESCRLSPEEREFFNQVDEASTRATELTRQLLALGRRQTMQFREIRPDELVRNFLKLIRRVIGENIEVVLRSEDGIDTVLGDAGQLEQVLLNLCVNARDAMPQGGRLQIELHNLSISMEETVAWPWARPGRHVKISLSDTGAGMSPDTAAKIFEPFFTTKPVGKGTGLGLSVVQGIVQQHGGFINVHSEPAQGSTFSVYLPSQKRGTAHPEPGAQAPKPLLSDGSNELVLLVEDEAPVRFVASSILSRNGYRVIPAADGEEALRVALPQLADISLAVLDVVMPRMGGVEAARRLQELKPGLPIILCTGYAGGISLPELNSDHGWTLLNKPYANQELLALVKSVLDARKPAHGRILPT